MDAAEFERDLDAWLAGELPSERATQMQSAADSSPEVAARVAEERAFDARVKRALMSDAADDTARVRAMFARARAANERAGRVLRLPRGAIRAAAAVLLAVVGGLWWFCVPPFECMYMEALELSSRDPKAVPGATADALAKRYALPSEIDGAKAADPVAATKLDFAFWHLAGVRLDYVRGDGAAFHVAACDSPGVRPSVRRRVDRDGLRWWRSDFSGACTWAFEKSGADILYAVTGPERDADSLYAAAKALRASIR